MDGWMEGSLRKVKGEGRKRAGEQEGGRRQGTKAKARCGSPRCDAGVGPPQRSPCFLPVSSFGHSRLQRAKTSFATLRPPSISTAQLTRKCMAFPSPTLTRRGGPLSGLTRTRRQKQPQRSRLVRAQLQNTAPRGAEPQRKRRAARTQVRRGHCPKCTCGHARGLPTAISDFFSFSLVNQW